MLFSWFRDTFWSQNSTFWSVLNIQNCCNGGNGRVSTGVSWHHHQFCYTGAQKHLCTLCPDTPTVTLALSHVQPAYTQCSLAKPDPSTHTHKSSSSHAQLSKYVDVMDSLSCSTTLADFCPITNTVDTASTITHKRSTRHVDLAILTMFTYI